MFPVLGISDGIAVPLYLHIGKNLLLIDQCMTDFLITEFICTFYRHFRSAALYGSVEDRLHLFMVIGSKVGTFPHIIICFRRRTFRHGDHRFDTMRP